MSNEDLSLLRSQLDEINKGIENINSISDGNSANKSLLTKQFEAKSNLFKQKYGIEITVENINEIKKQLIEQKKKEYESTQQIVSAINEGDIEKANRLAGIEVKAEVTVDKVDEGVKVNTEPIVQPSIEQHVQSTPIQTAVNQPVQVPQTATVESPTVVNVKPIQVPVIEDDDAVIPTIKTSTGIKVPSKIVVPDDAEPVIEQPVKTPITMNDLRETKVNDFMANIGVGSQKSAEGGSALAGTGFESIINNQ